MRDITGVAYLLLMDLIQRTPPDLAFLEKCAPLFPAKEGINDGKQSPYFTLPLPPPQSHEDTSDTKKNNNNNDNKEEPTFKKKLSAPTDKDEHAKKHLQLVMREQSKLMNAYEKMLHSHGGTLLFWQTSEEFMIRTSKDTPFGQKIKYTLGFIVREWKSLKATHNLHYLFLPHRERLSQGVQELIRLDMKADSLQKMARGVFSDLSHKKRNEHAQKDEERAFYKTQSRLAEAEKIFMDGMVGHDASYSPYLKNLIQGWLETVLNGTKPEWPHKKCLLRFLEKCPEDRLSLLMDKESALEGLTQISAQAKRTSLCSCRK